MTRWTDDEILDALYLADQGWSFSQIGAHLGRSRNSVSGAIKRARDAIYVSERRRSLPMQRFMPRTPDPKPS